EGIGRGGARALQEGASEDHEQRERQQRFDNEDDRAHESPAVWDRVWVRRGQLAPAQRRGFERPRHGGAQARVLEYAQRRLGRASPGGDLGPQAREVSIPTVSEQARSVERGGGQAPRGRGL